MILLTVSLSRLLFTSLSLPPPLSFFRVIIMLLCSVPGDAIASRNTDESETDKRVAEAIEMEDPDIHTDLRYQNTNGSDKYSVFWTKCKQFLDECTAVHERHDSVTYMVKAISVHDLVEQVSKICPDTTPILSVQWVRLQFHPKNPRTKAAAQFRKNLPVKSDDTTAPIPSYPY